MTKGNHLADKEERLYNETAPAKNNASDNGIARLHRLIVNSQFN